MKTASTFLGNVVAVSGATASIHLSESISSGLAIINGTTYRVGQVGSFIRIPQGYKDLFGIVCEVGADAVPENVDGTTASGRWVKVQLTGESVGSSFERGISQHPNVGDAAHLVTDDDLKRIYGSVKDGHVEIGRLSSAENITVKIDLSRLVTRHSAVLGSTGSGKSTTVASLLRSISANSGTEGYHSARILLLDIHGEYSSALSDVASVFRVDPNKGENKLSIPYWALDAEDLVSFLGGNLKDTQETFFYDKITELKRKTCENNEYTGIDLNSLTVDTPVPFSLKQLWHDLINLEVVTFTDLARTQPTSSDPGDPNTLTAPKYQPHSLGNQGPYLPTSVPGIKRQLSQVRSRLLDKQYDFLLHPDKWEPDLAGNTEKDLPELLQSWLGHEKPITILDLSGVPSTVLIRLIGSILKIIYTALFWSREKSEGGMDRPLLVVMEEAHRYLHEEKSSASAMVQQIVKEGRKYGIGAMIVSQRPSEVDETILSQCGTFFALRLSNQQDRQKVKGTLPDNLAGLMDMLPILRTGEAIITGEAATLPLRCRIIMPEKTPNSKDPNVAQQWQEKRRPEIYMTEIYQLIAASWRAQSPVLPKNPDIEITREIIDHSGEED